MDGAKEYDLTKQTLLSRYVTFSRDMWAEHGANMPLTLSEERVGFPAQCQ